MAVVKHPAQRTTCRLSVIFGILLGVPLFDAGCTRSTNSTTRISDLTHSASSNSKDAGNDILKVSDVGPTNSDVSVLIGDQEACRLFQDSKSLIEDPAGHSLGEVFKRLRIPIDRLNKSRIDGINFARADAVPFSGNCELVITTGGFGGLSGPLSTDASVVRVEMVRNGSEIFPCKLVDYCCTP